MIILYYLHIHKFICTRFILRLVVLLWIMNLWLLLKLECFYTVFSWLHGRWMVNFGSLRKAHTLTTHTRKAPASICIKMLWPLAKNIRCKRKKIKKTNPISWHLESNEYFVYKLLYILYFISTYCAWCFLIGCMNWVIWKSSSKSYSMLNLILFSNLKQKKIYCN